MKFDGSAILSEILFQNFYRILVKFLYISLSRILFIFSIFAAAFSWLFLRFQKGIIPHRISIQAYGEIKPIAHNETEEGRANNRRVEVTLIKK